MNYNTDNQLFRLSANADVIPQISRNNTAMSPLEYIQADNDAVEPYRIPTQKESEYIDYTPVETAVTDWKPAVKTAKTVAVVAVSGAALYGGFLALAWLVVQVKFWLSVIVVVAAAIVADNMRHPRRTPPDNYGQPNPPTPDTPKGQININVTHNGHGDVNIKIK
jgi:hypothetical protein